MTSPLADSAWKNRIAVPLEFNSVDSACAHRPDERRIVGTELALPRCRSWQPALCESGELPPFSFGTVGDATARQQVAEPAVGAPGMAVTSQAMSGHQTRSRRARRCMRR